ncbi:hypothetical protein DYB32_007262 [Aphanomyces invadans]|uniref:Pre-mRNA-splicing factor CWC26 n=1 Tax=Aphanomyces invadans TaxID=157072 RepID=A0A3R6VTQ7_9STRA|nr:hypothetical protein DYB32_007262 [Aphanomyces invadans]
MASKLEALKRYMGGGAPGKPVMVCKRCSVCALEEKLKKKRKKKKTDGGFGMFVVDDEDAWDDSVAKQAKKKDLWQDERTDYDEDQPTIVGDGADEYDPESQPVVANAEEFLERERAEELEKQWLALEKNPSTDASPPRKDRQKDASPPRKAHQLVDSTNTSRRDDDAAQASSPHRQTAPDQSALGGVFTGKEFKAQQDQLRASQQAAFHDEELMGKQAETVYRDKRGRKLDMLMEMQRQQEIQEGKRKREAKEEFEWGTGKVRKEELKSQQNELEAIRAKKLRKDKQRDFDPMQSSLFKDELDEKVKRVPKKNEKPKYSGPPAPPNRFNIPPGYRWDGVVRGNNWEEKALLKVNARKALKQDMYQWATADM